MGLRFYLAVSLALLAVGSGRAQTIYPENLRTDHAVNPSGISTDKPRLSWMLKALDPKAQNLRQTAYRILVARTVAELKQEKGMVWDSGKVESAEQFDIIYSGKPLASGGTYVWAVRVWNEQGKASGWSAPAEWTVGLLAAADWHARWIAAQPDGETPREHMPVFRREFLLDKTVAKATLFISGLGQYEASVNGTVAGDNVLAPGWTDYRKTVLYNSYDVTSLLRKGRNAIDVMVGNGMFHVVKTPGRYTKLVALFRQNRVIAELRVQFVDGSSTTVVTDRNWKTRPGPIVYSHTFGGEDFDARLVNSGVGWTDAVEVASTGATLVADAAPPIRIAQTFKGVRLREVRPGVVVYDLGQNLSGFPQVTVKGPAGASVKIVAGELLNEAGEVSQASAGAGPGRRGEQWFTYILNGQGVEVWRPRFSYYGFRYVQVESKGGAQVEGVEGEFIHAAVPLAGEFACSKPLFNQIHKLILAAMKSNMQSVLTDCPHREKLGWLEQSHLAGSALMYNFDLYEMYRKIQLDMRDAQLPNGLVPDIAPEFVVFDKGFRDSPEWGSAVAINPWIFYQHYGTTRLIEESYKEMTAYARYLLGTAKEGIVSHGLGDWYDIGPKPPGQSQLTSMGLSATAVLYQDLKILENAAKLAGKEPDQREWAKLAASTLAAFNGRLFNAETGVYDKGSQTAYAMPLVLGMVPAEDRKKVLGKLVETIRQNGNRVTAGDVGFHYVVRALMDNGRSDVLYDMLARTDGPSYGMQIAKGATALTEAWDASPKSSNNHFMLGHADEWFYRGLAGIDIDMSRPVAAERITIAPAVVGDVTWTRASYMTIHGKVAVDWKREGATVTVDVTVPPNASATVRVPGEVKSHVVGSGHYRFTGTKVD